MRYQSHDGSTTFPFQDTGIAWLQQPHLNRCLLLDEQGLGKSAQAILGRHHEAVCIIAPCNVKQNWVTEISRWAPHLQPIVCKGRGSFTFPLPGQVIIANPEILPDFIPLPSHPITFIIDEVHMYRNSRPRKYLNAKYIISRLLQGSQVVGMTGTPICNRLGDLVNILDIVGLIDKFGGRQGFAELVGGKSGKRDDLRLTDPFTIAPPQLVRILKEIALRREKVDVLEDLPEKIYTVMRISEFSGALSTLMDKGLTSLDAYLALAGDKDVDLSGLPGITELARARAAMAKEKLPHVEPFINEMLANGNQVVMFSAHRFPVEKVGSREGWGMVTGSVSPKRRQAASEDLRANKLKGVALTLGSGCCGLNLQSADKMVFVDLAYDLATNIQAEDRCHRIGQKSPKVNYYFFTLEHLLEKRLGQICSGKKHLFDAICQPLVVRN